MEKNTPCHKPSGKFKSITQLDVISPARMALPKIQKAKIVSEDMEKGKFFIHCWWEGKLGSHCGKQYGTFLKTWKQSHLCEYCDYCVYTPKS